MIRLNLMRICAGITTMLTLAVCTGAWADDSKPLRERLLMDTGWRFILSADGGLGIGPSLDPGNHGAFAKAGRVAGPAGSFIDQSAWRTVDLPHDWAVELPFVSEKGDYFHGFKPVGPAYPETSVGWYRRSFFIPNSDDVRRIQIEFDGVYRDSEVFLNGHYLGRNFSGDAPFSFDLSPYLQYGSSNTLAVRVNANETEGWFYEGAGIYRHVWLTKTGPIYVPQWGSHLTSTVTGNVAKPNAANILARTTVRNDTDTPSKMTVPVRLLDHAGSVAASGTSAVVTVAPWSEMEIATTIKVVKPHLWSVDDPYLYQVETSVHSSDSVVDRTTIAFGIRTIRFDADKGFFLNGKRVFMKGTCSHRDHAGVGAAVPDRVNVWRIEQLKAMGCNAHRAAHDPPTSEFLDACDRLGMLVMDETRMVGASEEPLSQLERLIRRDRNHPSVVIWCLGNEEPIQGGDAGIRIMSIMHRLAKRLDPTRLTTVAMNGSWGEGFSSVVDVQGCNYYTRGNYDKFHEEFPKQPAIGTEEESQVTTRGIYEVKENQQYRHADDAKAQPAGWGSTAEAWINYYQKRPFIAGSFVWTGFDYRGEPHPFNAFPSISSSFGIMDTCGFPKDIFYFYQAWWTDKPVLHLMPHWNWPDQVGKSIEVRCDGNAEEVELFVNGVSQGRKPMPRLSHLRWQVTYQPGSILAKGFDGGKQVSETRIETTGVPAGIRLTPDRSTINAEGEDVSLVTVAVIDAKGRVVPTANDTISFTLDGPGRIIGVGNGDSTCLEPDKFITPAPVVVQASRWVCQVVAGDVNQSSIDSLDEGKWVTSTFNEKFNLLTETGQIGVWRGEFTVEPNQIADSTCMVTAGKVNNGDLKLFWNGKPMDIGSKTDDGTIALTSVNAGANVLVAIVTATNRGGLFKAPQLILQGKQPAWQRSVFNGLAQILVQSTRQAGSLTLTAESTNLTAATTTITTTPVVPRPFVP